MAEDFAEFVDFEDEADEFSEEMREDPYGADDDVESESSRGDTTAAQARRGKDIQGIYWDRLHFSREEYRVSRLRHYRNYQNLNVSHQDLEKECLQVTRDGKFYAFRQNTRAAKPSVVHFQTDGKSEIENSTILDLLKPYVSERQTDWEKYLSLVEYVYNNTVHSTIGLAPFEIGYGKPMLPPILMTQFVLLKFEKARSKKQALHKGKVVKLSNGYYGPFKIIDRVNDVTFRLDSPPSWKIHNAFHVSLLRPYMGPPPSEPVIEELPEIEEMKEILKPEQIVHYQECHLKSEKITRKYLVKFKNYSALDA
ncbi:hypothetical protein L7F22_006185 [Adiantum nelumboides]|nr:hypothetical protein [Adiantum nelumboides]